MFNEIYATTARVYLAIGFLAGLETKTPAFNPLTGERNATWGALENAAAELAGAAGVFRKFANDAVTAQRHHNEAVVYRGATVDHTEMARQSAIYEIANPLATLCMTLEKYVADYKSYYRVTDLGAARDTAARDLDKLVKQLLPHLVPVKVG